MKLFCESKKAKPANHPVGWVEAFAAANRHERRGFTQPAA
jgi:hypothetical protein